MKEDKSMIKLSLATGVLMLMIGLIYICMYADIGHQNVVINEVCGNNDAIIYDTMGNCHDYIEIYNPTDERKNISKLYLSDDKDDLMKYGFPPKTFVEKGEYLLLWAGIRDEKSLIEDDKLYTGFALRAGETLFLSDEDGKIIDKVKIPSEPLGGVAYSRISISNDVWKLTKGTPGTENETEPQEEKGTAKVVFSAEGGFYEESFYLEMRANKPCDIYYTLDGSEPTMESLKYEGPILIEDASSWENRYAGIEDITLREGVYIPEEKVTKATVVRAAAVDKKGKLGKESSVTYFMNFNEKTGFQKTPIISLITDPENLFGYESGIYVTGKVWDINKEIAMGASEYWRTSSPVNYMCRGNGWEKETTLQYYDTDGELFYQQQIGLGIHGKSSASYNQKSFNITALPEIDGKKYDYIIAGSDGGFGKLTNEQIGDAGSPKEVIERINKIH